MLRNSFPNPEDPRVKRTQKLLWETLRALLEVRSFEEISVTDICTEATINRTTFYKHFESKYELLSYGIKFDQETARRKHCQAKNAEEREQELVQLFERITSDYHYYERLLVDKENQMLSTLLRRQTAEVIEAQLVESQKSGRRFTVPLPIIGQFYAGASLALATWWLENQHTISSEELAHYWRYLCQGMEPLPDGDTETEQSSPSTELHMR
ncbi:TetR/AcrR family transcriptional regulator [Ktedonospora formicarum]|uniref:TetR family transcriptional regulator n=1 Tax=Ktedonospora formicarum TaxID=2778364 RepID=A0A8J3I5D4_9CHLR|nr:TetR/AcrR family transcriptional regulator [Ktedonospora formicarum]GHO45679.1 TetR family transcriptional regulator [Ktedonospora formicarum]